MRRLAGCHERLAELNLNMIDKDEELDHDRQTLANKACTPHILYHDRNFAFI
jgi:hypothetical protein